MATQLRAMLECGELSATKYTLGRVGFNDVMASNLLEALKQLPLSCIAPPVEAGSDIGDEE